MVRGLLDKQVGRKEADEMTNAELDRIFTSVVNGFRREGEAIGIKKGVVLGRREFLLLQLRHRFGRLPAATVARIREANAAQLDRWILRVLPAKTLNDVLPARARRKA